MGASYKINWFNYQSSSTSYSENPPKNQSVVNKTPSEERIEKIFNLTLSPSSISNATLENDYPLKRDIKRPFINKSDIYALNFYNDDNNLVYQIGIGDPFKAGVQHIGYENSKQFILNIGIKNYKAIVPQEVDASSLKLVRRTYENEFIEISSLNL
jgi:hypothetical protein